MNSKYIKKTISTPRGELTIAAHSSGNVVVSRKSPFGYRRLAIMDHTMEDIEECVNTWNGGAFIQDAFPTLSAEEREFILSGFKEEEWDKYLGGMGLFRASINIQPERVDDEAREALQGIGIWNLDYFSGKPINILIEEGELEDLQDLLCPFGFDVVVLE